MSRSSQRTGRGVNRGSLNQTASIGDTFPTNPGTGHFHTKTAGGFIIGLYKYNGSTWDVVQNGLYIGTASPPTTSTYSDMLWLDTN